MHASRSPATLSYPAGYRGTRLRLFTCVGFDLLQFEDRAVQDIRGDPDTQDANGSEMTVPRI